MAVTIDGTNGITFPNSTVQASAGKVLQVVSTAKTSAFTTSSTSAVDVTGMSVSITPTSASSKVLIIFYVGIVGNSNAGQASQLWLLRNSTQLNIGDTAGSRTLVTAALGPGSVNYAFSPASITFLDSPATTSATTYKIQLATQSGGGTACFNQRGDDSDSVAYQRSGASITVMEIAA
jgi:hypothetical protein